MRVAVAAGRTPFVDNARDGLVATLVAQLSANGVEAEALRLPVAPGSLAAWEDAAAMVSLIELFNLDRLIALDLPSSLLRGVATAIWFVEPHGAPASPVLIGAATAALSRAERVFAATPTIRDETERRTGHRPALLAVPAGATIDGWRPVVEALVG